MYMECNVGIFTHSINIKFLELNFLNEKHRGKLIDEQNVGIISIQREHCDIILVLWWCCYFTLNRSESVSSLRESAKNHPDVCCTVAEKNVQSTI